MSAVTSLSGALQAADEGLLDALRTGDVEAARIWADRRKSSIQQFASLVPERSGAGLRVAIAAAREATIQLCQMVERERDQVARELETIRVARRRLARAGVRRPDEPRFVSRRT